MKRPAGKTWKRVRAVCLGIQMGILIGLASSTQLAPHGLWELESWLCRRDVIDRLVDPVAVTGFTTEGVMMASGDLLPWDLGEPLPLDESTRTLLRVLTARGVEIERGGSALVLVPVFHWCGNDPVRRHLARVDLRAALRFLGRRNDPDGSGPLEFPRPQFVEQGWLVGDWLAFERWCGADPNRIYR